jgi:hypothetical protein
MKKLLLISFVLLFTSCGEIKKHNQEKKRNKTKEASQLLLRLEDLLSDSDLKQINLIKHTKVEIDSSDADVITVSYEYSVPEAETDTNDTDILFKPLIVYTAAVAYSENSSANNIGLTIGKNIAIGSVDKEYKEAGYIQKDISRKVSFCKDAKFTELYMNDTKVGYLFMGITKGCMFTNAYISTNPMEDRRFLRAIQKKMDSIEEVRRGGLEDKIRAEVAPN